MEFNWPSFGVSPRSATALGAKQGKPEGLGNLAGTGQPLRGPCDLGARLMRISGARSSPRIALRPACPPSAGLHATDGDRRRALFHVKRATTASSSPWTGA